MSNISYSYIKNSLGDKLKSGHAFSQAQAALHASLNIQNGVCRALSILWLEYQAKIKINPGKRFWVGNGIESELYNESLTLKEAINLQDEYKSTFAENKAELNKVARWAPDKATEAHLKEHANIELHKGDMTASAQFGFATTHPNNEPKKIAAQLGDSRSRFHILSISGRNINTSNPVGHSIGLYREFKTGIGRSDHFWLFDPNIGEFSIYGKSNLEYLLTQIPAVPIYSQFNWDKYVLWTYGS